MKTTEYIVRDNIYLHVTKTDFFSQKSSNNYDSDQNIHPESTEYIFILDESADFMNSVDRIAQRQETRELNNLLIDLSRFCGSGCESRKT